jgi:hypothetical protein
VAYFSVDDITDGLLIGKITDDCILSSTSFIDDLAKRYGVQSGEIKIDPVPYKIKKLAEYKALTEAALNLSTMTGADGKDGKDAYELKREIYEEKVAQAQLNLVAEDFRGGPKLDEHGLPIVENGAYPINIPFLRG